MNNKKELIPIFLFFITFIIMATILRKFRPDYKSTADPELSGRFDQKENKNNDDNNKFWEDLLASDELSYSEYEDDLDIDSLNEHKLQEQQDKEWDVLIFTQQWPVTTCYHWREHDHNHACKLPTRQEFWTIHGVWPTKLGHVGPSFCNKSADFDVNQLNRIVDNLELYWPDIDGQTQLDWLWQHEWLKHGTCAAQLNALDDELKYFGQGLLWRRDYLISDILGESDIHPDSNNTVIALQTALLKRLGKNPSIHCLYDDKKDVSYLAEIRICFDKSLELVDCDGVKRGDAISIDYPGGKVITNCRISKPVHYPSIVPSLQRQNKLKLPIVNLYKLIQFIMWFTL